MNEIDLLRKALLICACQLGYAEDEAYDIADVDVSDDEAQATCIYHMYARPKEIAKKMLESAKSGKYERFDLAVKDWESWYEKF